MTAVQTMNLVCFFSFSWSLFSLECISVSDLILYNEPLRMSISFTDIKTVFIFFFSKLWTKWNKSESIVHIKISYRSIVSHRRLNKTIVEKKYAANNFVGFFCWMHFLSPNEIKEFLSSTGIECVTLGNWNLGRYRHTKNKHWQKLV